MVTSDEKNGATKGLRTRARQAIRAGGLVSLTAAMLPGMIAAVSLADDARRPIVRDAWVRRWARSLLDLFAIEVVVDGPVPPPVLGSGRGRLIVANHRSAIDIGVLLATFGGTMVSRHDVAGWPLVGTAARAVGTVFVDRKSAKSGAATIRAIQKHLEQGATIALFPEGTTFDGDDVRPFRGGAFIAAARAGADILPVGLAYPVGSGAAYLDETFTKHLGRLAASDPTRVVVAVGTPILTDRASTARDLTDQAHAAVVAAVSRARARC